MEKINLNTALAIRKCFLETSKEEGATISIALVQHLDNRLAERLSEGDAVRFCEIVKES